MSQRRASGTRASGAFRSDIGIRETVLHQGLLRGTYCSLNAKTTLSLGTFRSVQMRFAWATMHDLCARRASQFASELRRDKLHSRVTCRLRFVSTSYLSTTGHLVTFSGRFSSLHFIRRHVKLSAFFRHARCTSTSLPHQVGLTRSEF